MEVEKSKALALKDLLDKDGTDLQEGDICVQERPKEKKEEDFFSSLTPGDTVWLTGDIPTLRACWISPKLETESELSQIRNAHGLLISVIENVALCCIPDRTNTIGLKKIQVKLQAFKPMSVLREEEVLSSNQGRTFDALSEIKAVADRKDENLTQSDEELLNKDPSEVQIEEFWRYTVASDTIPETWLEDRCKYIPLRLTLPERKYMRLVKNTMDVSEYTDRIDIMSWRNKTRKIHKELTEICSILSGFVVACNYREGQKLIKDKNFTDNEPFFQSIFEIARRYKVLNPEKMRTQYGKLIHVLMDAQSEEVLDLMGFCMVKPVQTVYSYFKEKGCLEVLTKHMALILNATSELNATNKTRNQIDRDLRKKDMAFKKLMRTLIHSYPQLEEEECEYAVRSISDNHNFLQWARSPVDTMICWLKKWWAPGNHDNELSLAINFGREGARLSHSHSKQYLYVLQSLTLWREILHEMFRLWYLAEQDLLEQNNDYRLSDTGQGLNRIQRCPRIARAMRNILARVQQKCGSWVGSSVVHLGDHNVPNALTFIDKYNQVPRILNPIVITINMLPRLCRERSSVAQYVKDNYGNIETLSKTILSDFFRHGFDGSGADNFFDAGSCIDGRLTSAWNWCESISKKKYYPIFQLTGFNSFDGDW